MPTPLQRRQILQAAVAAPFVCSTRVTATIANLAEAQRWLDALARNPAARSTQGWPLPQVLVHLAQSIHYSVQGFPEPKPAIFQATVGAAAFAWFQWRGRMSHSLTEPIPGAPALGEPTLPQAITTLRQAIATFDAHSGPLQPHFAYGSLSKADYAQAHLLHVANHRQWING